jgi:hypothetical protein
MDEIKLRSAVAAICQILKSTHEASFQLRKVVNCMKLALRDVPGFEKEYNRQWEVLSAKIDREYAASLQYIDRLVRELKA